MKTIYLVLPCFNEEECIENSAIELAKLMHEMQESKIVTPLSKVYFVNDGSTDITWKLLERICAADEIFCAISLARNSGHQNALIAGMLEVKDMCDAVITLDADLQHDINAIPHFIERFEQGYEIVYGVRKSRAGGGFLKGASGNAFYDIMQLSGAKVIKNHADYRLMSSKALNALDKYEEVNLYLRGIIPLIGFNNTILEYEEKPRLAGTSKYSLRKMLRLATDGITSFSVRPLQMIAACGIFFFGLSVVMLLYALIVFLQKGTVSGWTSIVAPVWLLGGIQLLSLGIVGEYIGKIYMETKHRPRYEVDKRIIHKK